MEYHGKLYGKIGNKYFDTGETTEDWDRLEAKVDELHQKVKQLVQQANEFIIDVAKLLGMDTDGLGYDELQYSIDDFEDAIRALAKPPLNEHVLPVSEANVREAQFTKNSRLNKK